MGYTYYLPDAEGNQKEYNTSNQALIIVGANGAGKSRLGAWIERCNTNHTHRIAPQRNLNFAENIPLKNYKEAENKVIYGYSNVTDNDNKFSKWGSPYEDEYTIKLINDFDEVLSAMVAKYNNETNDFYVKCREASKAEKKLPNPDMSIVEKVCEIWNDIFPHRSLIYNDSRFHTQYTDKKYSATKMSDGERGVLYLIAQIVCVPENFTVIIDEPELHLHKSILNKLWTRLECYRRDCFFIYITHDTQFASMHNLADKIWVKSCNGNNIWEYSKIETSDLPEELLLDILGNRRNVIFIEGDYKSYDIQLYTSFYKDFYIVPCGGCSQVIERTKAFSKCSELHHLKVYGIIDRDYRSDNEIEQLKKYNIFTISVAEVENLFITKEMIYVVADSMAVSKEEVFNKIKKYIIDKRFRSEINKQICEGTVYEIKYRFNTAYISGKNEDCAIESLNNFIKSMDYDQIRDIVKDKFTGALESCDYDRILSVFNRKSLSLSIGHYMRLNDKEYPKFIIDQVKNNNEKYIEALKKYLPDIDNIMKLTDV